MLSIVMLIVDAIATLLGGALLLRFWMQAIRVRPPSSVAQFTFQLSDWLVRPLRRIVPGVGTAMRRPGPTRFLPQARPLERLAWRQLPSSVRQPF